MIRIIPAIDIINGKCVRLTQGDYQQKKVYHDDPVAVAKNFEDQGFKYLHVVDLDGAKASHIVNYKTLEAIARNTNLNIDFGGGIKSDQDLEIAFNSGASQITGGTIAVKKPVMFRSWIEKYGADKIILGADVLHEKIAVSGWQESSNISIFDFLKDYISKGIEYVICTDISKDGMLEGSAEALYRKIRTQFPDLKLIASGGVSSREDINALDQIGCEGVIIGKAFYEGKIKY